MLSVAVVIALKPLNCQSQHLSSALSSGCDFKNHSRSSLIRVHTVCLHAKNRFEKFESVFSRQHKQTTFSDAGFLGILRVKG